MILRFAVLVLLFVAAAAGAAFVQSRVDGDPSRGPPIELASVDSQSLMDASIDVRPPSGGTTIRQRDAERRAIAEFPGATGAIESRLVDFNSTGEQPPSYRLCWVISLAPAAQIVTFSGGPPSSPGTPRRTPPVPRYVLVFIDARTGEFVMSAAAS